MLHKNEVYAIGHLIAHEKSNKLEVWHSLHNA